jgi:hypothetical protein
LRPEIARWDGWGERLSQLLQNCKVHLICRHAGSPVVWRENLGFDIFFKQPPRPQMGA